MEDGRSFARVCFVLLEWNAALRLDARACVRRHGNRRSYPHCSDKSIFNVLSAALRPRGLLTQEPSHAVLRPSGLSVPTCCSLARSSPLRPSKAERALAES